MSAALDVMRAVNIFNRTHHYAVSVIKNSAMRSTKIYVLNYRQSGDGDRITKTFNGIIVEEVPKEHHLSVE